MAILGYCLGILAISFGQGSVDAFIGILGGTFGGIVYILILPFITPVLGLNLGAISLNSWLGTHVLFFSIYQEECS